MVCLHWRRLPAPRRLEWPPRRMASRHHRSTAGADFRTHFR